LGSQNLIVSTNSRFDTLEANDSGNKFFGVNYNEGNFTAYYTYYSGGWQTPVSFKTSSTYLAGALTADGTRGVMNNSWFPWTATAPGTFTTFGTAAPAGSGIQRLTADGSRLVTNAAGVMGYYTWTGTTYANFTPINLPNFTMNTCFGLAPDGSFIFYIGTTITKLYFAFWNGSTYANETLNVSSAWNTFISTDTTVDYREISVGYKNVVYFSRFGSTINNLLALAYNNSTGYFDKLFNLGSTNGHVGGLSVCRLSAAGSVMWTHDLSVYQFGTITLT